MPLIVLPPALFYERMPSRNSTNGSARRALPTKPGNRLTTSTTGGSPTATSRTATVRPPAPVSTRSHGTSLSGTPPHVAGRDTPHLRLATAVTSRAPELGADTDAAVAPAPSAHVVHAAGVSSARPNSSA